MSFPRIERIKRHDIAYWKELGLSLKLLGVAERVGDGEISSLPCFRFLPGHPLSLISGPFERGDGSSPRRPRSPVSGPGRGGPLPRRSSATSSR